jgi:hypothetical protein
MRRHLAWPIALPLAVLGALAGHAAGYRVAVPDAHERAHLLEQTGHGYFAYIPIVVGVGLALAVLGFAAMVIAAVRHGHRRWRGARTPAWLVALLPPLGFVLQEHVERYTRHGEFEWATALEPAFLVGLAMQLPFALLVALVAYALGRLAECVAGLIAAAAPPRLRVAVPSLALPARIDLPLAPILARGYSGRAPPRLG